MRAAAAERDSDSLARERAESHEALIMPREKENSAGGGGAEGAEEIAKGALAAPIIASENDP